MDNQGFWRGVMIALLCIGFTAAIGASAFHLGFAHGLAASGQVAAALPGIAPYAYAWPWAYHGFFLTPFFWLILFAVMIRALVGRRHWRGGWHHHGSHHHADGVPPAFEAWHRQAHAQQDRSETLK